jgi:hypothetical protein
MLSKFKRRLSRTKSEPTEESGPGDRIKPLSVANQHLVLSPSVEQLVNKLSFAPEVRPSERTSRHKSSSIGTRWSERTVFNNVESGFLALPTECLLNLQQYLSLSSEVSLRQSCSRFFHLYNAQSFILAGLELFEFLCMVERDQDPSELDRLVCGTCKELHPRKTFPASEIHQQPLQRDCRQIWLCAHKCISYTQSLKLIKAGAEAPFRAENILPCSRCRDAVRHRSVADRPGLGISDTGLENPQSQSLLISKIGFMQAPTPVYGNRAMGNSSGMYKEVFDIKKVSAALQSINFQICPHLKLGDPFILGKFCRSCINTQKLPPGVKGPPCISESDKKDFGADKIIGRCKGTCFTRGCRTQFMFQSRESLTPDASGRRQIWLIIVIYRWLGPLLTDARDKNWTAHASTHRERLDMSSSWAEWDRVTRGQSCMPNWSICSLHPDDSNLR